jgi:serine/threonine protein kinase
MTVRVTCPNPDCGAVANVEEQSLGRRGRCKKCGHVVALARPDGDSASVMSGDASAWKGSSPGRPTASPNDLPEQFGRYRILRPLGQGGMGAVYLAHDTKLDRPVALKVPFFHPADGPQAIQRFEREARAAANLDHPNLCPIYDVGEVDGIHYLTMPYIEGKPLSEALAKDQTFTEAQAAAVVRKLALALQEAHEKGVVHRDLKPANIMIKKGRDFVIMDFGLARMVGGGDGALTRTGHVLGTALYMAPEQAAGDTAATGPACDVYALGVILHELLTGRRPFEGPWSLVIGLKNVKDPDPPSTHRPGLIPALDAICLKALAQKPGDRYPTMAEFAEALGGFLASAASPAPAATPTGKATPARKPESLSAQAFEGLVSTEVTSLREEMAPVSPKPSRPDGGAPRLPARMWIAVAGAVGALLLGIIIYVATDNGRIKIEVNDPKAVVKVDGKEVLIEGLGEPITLRAGEHELSARRGDGEFQTKKFVVRRGDNEDLIVRFEPKAGSTDDLSGEIPPREPPRTNKPPASTAGIPTIPDDAKAFQGQRFKVFNEELTWHEAKAKCEAMGGHLAIVTREGENEFLIGILSEAGASAAWLGATDELVEGRWLWVDGTVMGYNDWDSVGTQPNNKRGLEHYLAIYRGQNGWKWCDQPNRSVEQKVGFVCQWDATVGQGQPALRPAVEVPGTAVTWRGDPTYWKVRGSKIEGSYWIGQGKPHTFLFSEKSYKDFELKCRFLLRGGLGNSGIQIRSEMADEAGFLVRGPQVDIGGKYWGSLYGEDFPPGNGSMMQAAPADLVANIVNPNGFNDFVIKCVGKHLTVKLNGSTTINEDFPQMPNEGRIGWQLHSGAPVDITVEDLEITELTAETKADGFRPLFNGKDLAGWKTAKPDHWRVENGLLTGSGPSDSILSTERDDYKDFHLHVEARINDGGNSGIFLRNQSTDRHIGYEAQIDITHKDPNRTGSLYRAPGGCLVHVLTTRTLPENDFAMDIMIEGNHIVILVNGQKTVDFFDEERMYAKGYIALQQLNPMTVVRFRKIEIKETKYIIM